MTEADVIQATPQPLTVQSLAEQFAACGLAAGQTVLVHSAMSKIGWIAGGPEAVILALLQVLTPSGTLMMPAHSTQNTDPAQWGNPPVPESWVPVIRAQMPAYNPHTTPTRQMGAIAELFRTWPGAVRSAHPTMSFAALGPQAAALTADHVLEADLGEGSPIGRLYQLDGHVLLLGVGHSNNTSLHLAEFRADWPGKRYTGHGSAMLVNGQRQWVEYEALELDSDDFDQIGAAYEAQHPVQAGRVGSATVRFFRQRPIVDFAVQWMQRHRRDAVLNNETG